MKGSSSINKKIIYGFGFVMGMATFASVWLYSAVSADRNRIDVPQGYATPFDLEFRGEDLDDDGKNEVIATYKGKSYLFLVDENGKPELRNYKINQSSSPRLEVLSETK